MENILWKAVKFASVLLIASVTSAGATMGIGCYVCHSFNKSNDLCEDPFNTGMEEAANYYSEKCMGYRKNRTGYFPADHCIKIKGTLTSDTSEVPQSIMIRTCSLDSGTLTADTEIVRMSHCGHFKYNTKEYSGCVQSCGLTGCNAATGVLSTPGGLHTRVVFAVWSSTAVLILRTFSL